MLFPTPHTGEATCYLLYDLLDLWNLNHRIRTIKSDNGRDLCCGVEKLCDILSLENTDIIDRRDFHVRGIAQLHMF